MNIGQQTVGQSLVELAMKFNLNLVYCADVQRIKSVCNLIIGIKVFTPSESKLGKYLMLEVSVFNQRFKHV